MRVGAMLLLLTIASATLVVAGESVDAAARALDELRAANAARAAQARETQVWNLERDRIQALLDTLELEATQAQAQLARENQRQTAADRQSGACAAERQRLEEVRAIMMAQAQAISAALHQRAAQALPGVVILPAATGGAEATFEESVRALEASERAAHAIVVELIDGRIGGETRAVKLLRVADLGWWIDLDGDGAGFACAAAEGGKPADLQPLADGEGREAIRRAIAIIEGRRVPESVRLPVPPALAAVAAPGGTR